MRGETLIRKTAKTVPLAFGAFHRDRTDDLVVLLYHRVGVGDREIDLDVQSFERQMALVSQGGEVRPLGDLLADENGGRVAVTFDDGSGDFVRHVVPILERWRVPALLYLATGSVEATTAEDPLSWADLRDAVATGLVSVGSHTHSHADLSAASEHEATDEMKRSKDLVEDQLGIACRHFAYPWAVASPAAERAGRLLFDSAALLWRTNRRSQLDRHRLGRTPVLRADGPRFFRAKLNGRLDGEALIYRALRRGPWRRT